MRRLHPTALYKSASCARSKKNLIKQKRFAFRLALRPQYLVMPLTQPSIDWTLPPGPWVAYRLNGNYDFRGGTSKPGELRGAGILETVPLTNDQCTRLRTILNTEDSFGGNGMRCFIPGLGFTVNSGTETIEILMCLQCYWAYFFHGETKLDKALSETGKRQLSEIYAELFPNSNPELA